MKRWGIIAGFLIALACVVPFSSKRPDAVQHALGLPGGVDQALKAIGGIAVTMAALMLLVLGLKRLGPKQ